MSIKRLEFEKPIDDLYDKIDQLKTLSKDGDIQLDDEIAKIELRAEKLKEEIYSSLNPMQVIQIARHPDRPDSLSLIKIISEKFEELHGDRQFKDDPALVGGIAQIRKQRVVFLGHQKGHETKENIYRNFGMPNPEGYRKALRLMRMAERFNMPIVTFIDTPGAFPGIEAEERGQAEAIARNLRDMMGFKVPILSFVIGEGGSGGALGIGVANKLFMLQNSVYSVISPEGCASILFRDAAHAPKAAEILKITAKDINELGISDGIIAEPQGGGHHDWDVVASNIRKCIIKELNEYAKKSTEFILDERYEKFRSLGRFEELS